MLALDFRSDTVTQPTPAMREAMAQAEVGDDVYGEDPTVNRLQEMAGARMGKEAALFVASGTMGNLIAYLTHCQRGDEVILGDMSHSFLFEAGGMSALGGIHPHTIPNQPDGTLAFDDIREAIRPDDPHDPITRLVALENTHNRCAGSPLSVEYTRAVGELAKQHGLILHIDGARLFNAAVAQGVSAKDLAAPADSVTFCLSKALSAPVGSLLCGSQEFIHRALRVRKMLGGGMRQAGVLAAAGIVALEQMVDRLADDHRRAGELARNLSKIPGLAVDVENQRTNMVYFELNPDAPMEPEELPGRAKARGLLFNHVGGRRFRMVTHCWIDDESVKRAAQIISDVLAAA